MTIFGLGGRALQPRVVSSRSVSDLSAQELLQLTQTLRYVTMTIPTSALHSRESSLPEDCISIN